MGASVNCLAKCMRVIKRIAKAAILHGLCQEGVGVSVNCLAKCMRVIKRIVKAAILHGLCQEGMGINVKKRIFTLKEVRSESRGCPLQTSSFIN